jgi:hypothetical protein
LLSDAEETEKEGENFILFFFLREKELDIIQILPICNA